MAKKMVISLRSVFESPKGKRARRAMRKIKSSISKAFHVEPGSVFISNKINSVVFERGFEKIPRRVSVMVQQDGAKVKAFLAGEKIPVKKKEEKKKHEKKEAPEKEATEEIERKKKEKRAKEIAAEKTAIKMKSDKG